MIKSARHRWYELLGRVRLASAGIQCGQGVKAVGAPEVWLHKGSCIVLGDQVTLISGSFATALGVNHPVVLRTLRSGAEIHIGARSGVSGGTICAACSVVIGEETLLGANVTITDTDFHSLHPAHRAGHSHPSVGISSVRIGRRVLIGTNSIVLKGVTIGDNSIIGAGSMVTKSIPANSIAAGNPCRVIRSLTREELGVDGSFRFLEQDL